MSHFLLDESNEVNKKCCSFRNASAQSRVHGLCWECGTHWLHSAELQHAHEGACWSEDGVLFVLALLLYSCEFSLRDRVFFSSFP